MLPAPMNPICMRSEYGGSAGAILTRRERPSGLVEEALFDELGLLLGRDLNVARGQHEDLVRDPLHAAVEGVRQAAGEVDQPLGEVVVGVLEVQDDRDAL